MTLIQLIPAPLAAHLEWLVPRVLVRLTDLRDHLRCAANLVLNELCKAYHPEALFPSVLRALDEKSSKVKLGCLEFLYHLTPEADAYLSHGVHLRHVRTFWFVCLFD